MGRFALLREDLTVENDMLTPTLKLKRRVIVGRYKAEIERLYQWMACGCSRSERHEGRVDPAPEATWPRSART